MPSDDCDSSPVLVTVPLVGLADSTEPGMPVKGFGREIGNVMGSFEDPQGGFILWIGIHDKEAAEAIKEGSHPDFSVGYRNE